MKTLKYRVMLPIAGLVMGLLAPALSAQVISPEQQRTELLETVDKILNTSQEDKIAASALQEVRIPFIAVADMPKATSSALETTQQKTVAQRFPDPVALQLILREFKPTGSLIGPKGAILNMSNGRRYEKGSSFTANMRGESYVVTVVDVTPDAYTLRLGDAVVTRTFMETRLGSEATIQRYEGPDAVGEGANTSPEPQP